MTLMTESPADDRPVVSEQSEDIPRAYAERIASRLFRPMPEDRLWGWLAPILVTLLGALLRWPNLGQPRKFVFDETYYAKDAFSLLRYGYEQQFVDKANDLIIASNGDINSLDTVFKTQASYVVHPPLGKWVIAFGEWLFGMNPFGWRFSVAVLGTLMILITARIVRRLTRSTLIGTLAGFLVAIDGMAIVLSRTALLDGILAFFILCAFGALIRDRDMVRERFARQLRSDHTLLTAWQGGIGPSSGPRPWLAITGIFIGCAIAVKWSALWHMGFFGLLVFAFGIGTRRVIGVKQPLVSAAFRDGIPALLPMVVLPIAVYISTWTGWFSSTDAWFRNWAATNPSSMTWIPDALRSLWHYHAEAWKFHVGLKSDHAYEANAWNWPILGRPTSFFYESPSGCGAKTCSQEILALGNPIIWWAGVLALFHQAWRWLAVRDPRSGVIVVAWLAGWFPWLLFQQRTIFAFYAVVLVPFLCAAVAMSLGQILGPTTASYQRRRRGALIVGGFLILATAASAFFLPIWVADLITYDHWRLRMWFPSWI